ncbi:MAG: uracil-DNA glycosylase [Candidatus Omnitrophota bacterium]
MLNAAEYDLKEILRALRSYMELEKASGVEELYFPVHAGKGDGPKPVPDELETLKKELSGCKACDLYKTRTNIVFGSGNGRARLMFVGEAPGEEEDRQALPFVGRAGQLLTRIIEAMGLKRQDVYIANVLKCRPPNNRVPLPTEILACEDNLKRQIDIIHPVVICTLGKSASQTLLRTQEPIGALRGKFREYNGIKVMPTFHPAYLLRNPSEKKTVWEDVKKIKRELEGK